MQTQTTGNKVTDLRVVAGSSEPTMSSLQLREIVNAAREEQGEGKIENRHFVARIEDELGDEIPVVKFFRPDRGGTPQKYYDLTRDQCTLVGMRESKGVRRSVLEKLKEMESGYRLADLTPAEMILEQAKRLVEHERRIADIEHQQAETDAQVKALVNGEDYYTVVGYANLLRRKVDTPMAGRIGKVAARVCRDNDWHMGSAPHPRFGEIKTYPAEALETAFREIE